MQKEVKFQTEEFVPAWAADYSERKFSVFSTCFLSTKKNSHELNISEEVLRRDASSILGNFLVAKLQLGDATAHLPDEIIYGYFPKEQEVEFDTSEEGIVKAKAYCVISKMYGSDFNEIFSADNLRNTSVEMLVSSAEDDEHEVTSFDIFGLTCLGKTVRGSCPDANMQMVRFDEKEAEEFFKSEEQSNTIEDSAKDNETKFEENGKEGESKVEIEFAAVNIGDLWTSLYNALRHKYEGYDYCIQDIYEQGGQKFALIKKYGEDILYRIDFTLTEDGLTLADEMTKVEIEVVETDEIRKFAEPENVEQYRTFATEEEKKDENPEPKDDEDEEKKTEMSADEMKAEMARLQAVIDDKENVIMENTAKMEAMETELSDLREFKKACMEAERASKVEATLAKYAGFMDEKTAKSYRDEGLECDFAAIDGWANKVAASVTDAVIAQKQKAKPEEEFTRMSGVDTFKREDEDANLSPLDRLKKKYL